MYLAMPINKKKKTVSDNSRGNRQKYIKQKICQIMVNLLYCFPAPIMEQQTEKIKCHMTLLLQINISKKYQMRTKLIKK